VPACAYVCDPLTVNPPAVGCSVPVENAVSSPQLMSACGSAVHEPLTVATTPVNGLPATAVIVAPVAVNDHATAANPSTNATTNAASNPARRITLSPVSD
jgi:hypothetical protein